MKTNYYIEVLKDRIREEYAPRQVNIQSCADLALDVFYRTGENISASTLQRFFDFVIKKSAISKTSLNILSDYVGFYNWENFCRNQDSPNTNLSERLFPDEMGLRLLDLSLKNHNFFTVVEYLKGMPKEYIEELPISDVHRISKILGNLFRKDPVARKVLLPELAKSDQGRIFFYENFVDTDYRYYVDAIHNYKRYINTYDSLLSVRDYVFASSIQIFDAMKSNKKRLAVKMSYELFNRVNPKKTDVSTIGSPLPTARYYAIYMAYLHISKRLDDKKTFQITARLNSLLYNSNNIIDNSFIVLQLFQALYYCERYQDIIIQYDSYISANIQFDTNENYYIQLMNIVQLTYQKTGNNMLS